MSISAGKNANNWLEQMQRNLLFAAFILLLGACAPANETRVSIPADENIRLEAFIRTPTTPGVHPVVIYSHGSSGGALSESRPAQTQADYFAARGYVFIAVMRRGRGGSTGGSREWEEKNCDPGSWEPGLRDAFGDLTAVIGYAKKLPEVDGAHILLAGASRGGFLSVAYAAAGALRDDVAGVLNFSGGWVAQREDNCPIDFNLVKFSSYGAASRKPSLWLYGEDDAMYGDDSVQSYIVGFHAAGGVAKFEHIVAPAGEGHNIVNDPALWARIVDSFLTDLARKPMR